MDGEPARLAGAALNTDGAARHGLRVLRHPPIRKTKRTGAPSPLGKRLGGLPLRIETAAFLAYTFSTRMPHQSGLWRPFEAGRHLTVWRSTRQASAILLTAEVPAVSEGVKAPAPFVRVGRLGT